MADWGGIAAGGGGFLQGIRQARADQRGDLHDALLAQRLADAQPLEGENELVVSLMTGDLAGVQQALTANPALGDRLKKNRPLLDRFTKAVERAREEREFGDYNAEVERRLAAGQDRNSAKREAADMRPAWQAAFTKSGRFMLTITKNRGIPNRQPADSVAGSRGLHEETR